MLLINIHLEFWVTKGNALLLAKIVALIDSLTGAPFKVLGLTALSCCDERYTDEIQTRQP